MTNALTVEQYIEGKELNIEEKVKKILITSLKKSFETEYIYPPQTDSVNLNTFMFIFDEVFRIKVDEIINTAVDYVNEKGRGSKNIETRLPNQIEFIMLNIKNFVRTLSFAPYPNQSCSADEFKKHVKDLVISTSQEEQITLLKDVLEGKN